jgi:glyoxylase-like metal-dependent hydrolase (beta-lactamase superfamily II)
MKPSKQINHTDKNYFEVAPGIWGMKIIFVNIYMIAQDDHWILVDAGLGGFAGKIIKMAADLFGENKPPAAIILTHGHFDHRGAIDGLLKKWDVPVYAHALEQPFLRGRASYPPPDPNVGGGLMSLLSVFYPKRPINLGNRLQTLPKDGTVPFLPDWQYVFTPGHSPGHISLFRTKDKVLIAGDAFVTTKQESAVSTLASLKILSGPPKYFTPDWLSAKDSVIKLRDLQPAIAATGHGKPMEGAALTRGLDHLAANFDEVAVPSYGRYVKEPAVMNRAGMQFIPSAKISPVIALSFLGLLGLITFSAYRKLR